jgi:hypothetical protein
MDAGGDEAGLREVMAATGKGSLGFDRIESVLGGWASFGFGPNIRKLGPVFGPSLVPNRTRLPLHPSPLAAATEPIRHLAAGPVKSPPWPTTPTRRSRPSC